MYNLSAIVEKEESWYVSHCVELQVTSQGKSIEEALENLKEAVSLYLKHTTFIMGDETNKNFTHYSIWMLCNL